MPMDTVIRQQWQTDLNDTDAFPQTSGALCRESEGDDGEPEGYCCLGVLCEQAYRAGILERQDGNDDGRVGYRAFGDQGWEYESLPVIVMAWAGLTETDPAVSVDSVDGYRGERTLTCVNDAMQLPFPHIARLIGSL